MLLNRHREIRNKAFKKASKASSEIDHVDAQEIVDLDSMNVDELKAYAEENGIDIGKASSEEGILKKIHEATE